MDLILLAVFQPSRSKTKRHITVSVCGYFFYGPDFPTRI